MHASATSPARFALLDYAIAGALGLGSFFLSCVNYWYPPSKIFDEVYFARAGEEYLKNTYIYESTHPPLTKLIITFSMMLFGGLKPGTLGDTAWGWRFMDVVFSALVVMLLYAFAKRITGSRLFSAIAAVSLVFDGMHFVQSRIGTPEGIVIFFSLAALYAFYRYWEAAQADVRAPEHASAAREIGVAAFTALALGFGTSLLLVRAVFHQSTAATVVCGVYGALGIYLAMRRLVLPRLFGYTPRTPGNAALWLLIFSVALGALVASKWYGVMAFGVSFVVVLVVRLRHRDVFRPDVVLTAVLFIATTTYAFAYVPDFLRASSCATCDIHSLSDAVYHQYAMYQYHSTLRATHPYASSWWQWPLDLRPVLYFTNYARTTTAVIYSLPNPILLWIGLIAVPIVGVLAWRERNNAYALIVLAYLLQWLPWMFSPRIAWEYHFYVNIPLICLCNVIVLQHIWRHFRERDEPYGPLVAGAYVVAVMWAFVFFYPILAGQPISTQQWHERQWLKTWL